MQSKLALQAKDLLLSKVMHRIEGATVPSYPAYVVCPSDVREAFGELILSALKDSAVRVCQRVGPPNYDIELFDINGTKNSRINWIELVYHEPI